MSVTKVFAITSILGNFKKNLYHRKILILSQLFCFLAYSVIYPTHQLVRAKCNQNHNF